MTKAFVGVDPGLSGAWAAIDAHGNFLGCGDMIAQGKIIDTSAVWSAIKCATDGRDREFAIELVHAMPGQGVTSMFTFGAAFMAAVAIAQRSGDPTHMIAPRAWKKSLGLTADKAESLAMARKSWPGAPLARIKDGGRAEALLIAEWLRRSVA
jgi:crossover junction endodeoxyribonuclease RuvC